MIIYFFPFQMEENDAFLDAEVKYQKMKNKECYGVKASHKTPLSFLYARARRARERKEQDAGAETAAYNPDYMGRIFLCQGKSFMKKV